MDLFLFKVLVKMPYFAQITLNEVLEAEKEFYKLLREYWYDHNFLTPKWWFLVFLSILPALFWWKFVDKKRLTEILTYGLFLGVIATILDSIGSNALAWTYPIRLTPYLYPQLYPYDVGVVIIPFMLVYQKWGHQMKSYAIASLLLSFFIAFVAEPTMVWLGVYKEFTWKHIYSFPVYFVLALICRWIIFFIKFQEDKN
ncbi:CBO0543 family protein [Cytobacillus sp. FJAT-54145]|uniref:CBO0543 family protein n=1 Tax=Cytobacillus spartinae TaxID=3299023 RepID=A0ABW6K5Y4_9BACI